MISKRLEEGMGHDTAIMVMCFTACGCISKRLPSRLSKHSFSRLESLAVLNCRLSCATTAGLLFATTKPASSLYMISATSPRQQPSPTDDYPLDLVLFANVTISTDACPRSPLLLHGRQVPRLLHHHHRLLACPNCCHLWRLLDCPMSANRR